MRIKVTKSHDWKDQFTMSEAGLLVPKLGDYSNTTPDRKNFPKKTMVINMMGLKYQVIFSDPIRGIFHARLISGKVDRQRQLEPQT